MITKKYIVRGRSVYRVDEQNGAEQVQYVIINVGRTPIQSAELMAQRVADWLNQQSDEEEGLTIQKK